MDGVSEPEAPSRVSGAASTPPAAWAWRPGQAGPGRAELDAEGAQLDIPGDEPLGLADVALDQLQSTLVQCPPRERDVRAATRAGLRDLEENVDRVHDSVYHDILGDPPRPRPAAGGTPHEASDPVRLRVCPASTALAHP